MEKMKKLEEEKKDKAEIFKLKQKDRERLEAEAKELKKYQSKFFAEVEKALENQEGIKIKGDRFIFSSEILFDELAEGEYNLQVSYNSTCVFETLVSIEASNSYDCIAPEPTFSPNYDGSNDEFMPLNNYAEVVELTIFNRWGAKIFESKSANPSWDGTNLNGEVVPSADYYYIIKFNNPAYNDITGIITLLK